MNEKKGLNERLAHKKRIQRMKTGLIWFLLTWIVAGMAISIALIVKVHSLQKQIDLLTENTIRSQQVNQQENQSGKSNSVHKYAASAQADGGDGKDKGNSQEDAGTKGESGSKKSGSQGDADGNGQPAAVQANALTKAIDDGEDVKKVYLTFDDGPSTNTEKILDILDKYGVKATFFVTGREDQASLDMYKEIVDRGHTIGMHSYSHKYEELYSSLKAFKQDFQRIKNTVEKAAGIECSLYRFPGGSSNQVSGLDMKEFIRYLNKEGVTYFDWNAACGDATSTPYTVKQLVANVMEDVEKYRTSVVLMHDAANKPNTVKALPLLIKKLQASGAKVLAIDEDTVLVQHIQADSVK